MLRAVGFCAALTGCLRGMVPTDARIAFMLKDILAGPKPHFCLGLYCCVCGLTPQDEEG